MPGSLAAGLLSSLDLSLLSQPSCLADSVGDDDGDGHGGDYGENDVNSVDDNDVVDVCVILTI